MATGMNSTKTAARPSHEVIESSGGAPEGMAKTPAERLDREAMEHAKRAQNRIHDNEEKNPGDSIFSK
jgi:hypothetical protein